jgi:hypothetical protein
MTVILPFGYPSTECDLFDATPIRCDANVTVTFVESPARFFVRTKDQEVTFRE